MRLTRPKAAAVLLLLVAAGALVPLLRAESGETVGSADQVWIVRSDGQDLHKVNPSEKYQRDPAWSPDGRRLVFTSRSKGRAVIEIASADTGAIRRVAVPRRLGNPTAPAWSPRRDELAFGAVREGRFDLRRTIARTRLRRVGPTTAGVPPVRGDRRLGTRLVTGRPPARLRPAAQVAPAQGQACSTCEPDDRGARPRGRIARGSQARDPTRRRRHGSALVARRPANRLRASGGTQIVTSCGRWHRTGAMCAALRRGCAAPGIPPGRQTAGRSL